MADLIKNSQRNSTRFTTGISVDVLKPHSGSTVSHPLGGEWKQIGPRSTPVLGEKVQFSIPKSSYIGDLAIEFNFAAPSSGNYTTYVAMSAIERVQLLSQDGNEQHAYNYDNVMSHLLSTMSQSEADTILQHAGGTAHNAGRCAAPIPTFFGTMANGGKSVVPLPVHLLSGNLELEVFLRSGANILDAGASVASLTSMRLWYLHYNAADVQRSMHKASITDFVWKSVDWQTLTNQAVTASTPVSIDISGFHGQCQSLTVPRALQTIPPPMITFSLVQLMILE